MVNGCMVWKNPWNLYKWRWSWEFHLQMMDIPSGKLTVCYWKWWFSSWTHPLIAWWLSIVMLVYQRVVKHDFVPKAPQKVMSHGFSSHGQKVEYTSLIHVFPKRISQEITVNPNKSIWGSPVRIAKLCRFTWANRTFFVHNSEFD
jgi:hypothetical protein